MRKGRLLIVEDDPCLLDVLSRTFEAAGFGVTLATDGANGLQFATSIHPDAILTDFRMPVMDGLTMLEEIHRLPQCRHTPVILFAGSMGADDLRRAQNLNIAAHLTKGIHTPADAVGAITQVLAEPYRKTTPIPAHPAPAFA